MKKIKKGRFLRKKSKKLTLSKQRFDLLCVVELNNFLFLQREKQRELSSVGSEHRPYKAGVVGSSPTVPTK